jgi:hypothetical protein
MPSAGALHHANRISTAAATPASGVSSASRFGGVAVNNQSNIGAQLSVFHRPQPMPRSSPTGRRHEVRRMGRRTDGWMDSKRAPEAATSRRLAVAPYRCLAADLPVARCGSVQQSVSTL